MKTIYQMEILGLKWDELDWFRKLFRIERQLDRPDNTGVKFLEPKPKSRKRTIDLDQITVQRLRGHYEHLQAEFLASGRKWEELGSIFARSIGYPLHPRNLLR